MPSTDLSSKLRVNYPNRDAQSVLSVFDNILRLSSLHVWMISHFWAHHTVTNFQEKRHEKFNLKHLILKAFWSFIHEVFRKHEALICTLKDGDIFHVGNDRGKVW